MVVRPQTRDLIGRASLSLYFACCATVKGAVVLGQFEHATWQPLVALNLAAEVAALSFLVMIVATTFARLPPIRSAIGIQPRIVAFMGTFATVTFVALPVVEVAPAVKLLSDVLVLIGFSLCVWCLCWLGRSFSVLAQARRLVTSGPYRLVRHPLYACELVALTGIILGKPSWLAISIATVALIFQYLRIRNEEKVLRAAFPEYGAYSRVVPMLIPLTTRRYQDARSRASAPPLGDEPRS